ncbi:hypothetical protein AAHH18_03370 [Cellulomonas sp. P4]
MGTARRAASCGGAGARVAGGTARAQPAAGFAADEEEDVEDVDVLDDPPDDDPPDDELPDDELPDDVVLDDDELLEPEVRPDRESVR